MFLEALIEYRLCLCVRRGDFVRESLCPCCKIHTGVYVHVVKFIGGRGGGGGGGDYVHVAKFMGGIMSTYTNLSRGGGGCPTLSHCALKQFNAPHRESMRYLNIFTIHRCVARCVTGLS